MVLFVMYHQPRPFSHCRDIVQMGGVLFESIVCQGSIIILVGERWLGDERGVESLCFGSNC